MKTKFYLRCKLFMLLFVLIASSLACAEKYFASTEVFIRDSPSLDIKEVDVNNPLKDHEGLIFFPDGKFEAKIEIEGEVVEFSGDYGGDSVGNGFYWSLRNITPSRVADVISGLWFCETKAEEINYDCIELRLENNVITFIKIH